MTLGIAVLMNTGIALVADTRVSRGYHIVHDNAKKIVQLDDSTAVIHSGKSVDGWQEDLKSWHRICRESSGNDWLRYVDSPDVGNSRVQRPATDGGSENNHFHYHS